MQIGSIFWKFALFYPIFQLWWLVFFRFFPHIVAPTWWLLIFYSTSEVIECTEGTFLPIRDTLSMKGAPSIGNFWRGRVTTTKTFYFSVKIRVFRQRGGEKREVLPQLGSSNSAVPAIPRGTLKEVEGFIKHKVTQKWTTLLTTFWGRDHLLSFAIS